MPQPQQPNVDGDAPSRSTRPRADKTSVFHLIHTMAYGGIETIVVNWFDHLDRDRFDLKLVCFANPGNTERPFVDAARRRGIEVVKIPWGRRKPLFQATREFVRLVRQFDADIVHTHNVYADIVGWLAAKRTRAKTVASLYVWGEFGVKRNLL